MAKKQKQLTGLSAVVTIDEAVAQEPRMLSDVIRKRERGLADA